ncbi:uncharacterized protein [Watersipora subatra]|uniref:uncharacterized protein n=1 Tax=Watersipora subatra TaxID=2589382 RepID=UPI00355BE64F
MPLSYIPTDPYRLMLCEAYYHLGWAYNHIGEHSLALVHYKSAIQVFKKTKAGSAVAARSVDWLVAPVLCKKAFSHALLGDYNRAVNDVTEASRMATENMDMLCLEVLIHNTFSEYDKAMKLLVKGLAMNKSHEACRMLRSWLKSEGHSPHNDHPVNTELKGVTTLKHPGILEFIDRYLRTVSLPHTVEVIDLCPASSSQEVGLPCQRMAARVEDKNNFDLSWKKHSLSTVNPFKCGALPALFERDPVHEEEVHVDKHRRRDEYSTTLREHARKMRFLSQEQFTNLLEKNQSRHRLMEWKTKHKKHRKVGETITISAFKPIETQDVPRTYAKPWLGDRLQSAPLPVKHKQPIFYPSYS